MVVYDLAMYLAVQKKVMQLHRWLEGVRTNHDPGDEAYFEWSQQAHEAHCKYNHQHHTHAEEFREAFEEHLEDIVEYCARSGCNNVGNNNSKCKNGCPLDGLELAKLLGLKI